MADDDGTRDTQSTGHVLVTCPGCGDELVVDARTGAVIEHTRSARLPAGGKDFEELLADLDSQKDKAEQLFEQERAALRDRDRLLEEKFQKALKRVEDDDEDKPPERPFDFD